MARQNNTRLIGVVTELPRISKDPETGDYAYAMGTLMVVRGARNAQDGKRYLVYAKPFVFTKEKMQIREMESWQMYDLVDITGIFATTFVKKSSHCEHCGEMNRVEGSFAYVQPMPHNHYPSIRVMAHFDNEEDAMNELKMWALKSNLFQGIGSLGRDPKRLVLKGKTGKQMVVCQYPVVLNRLAYIPTDPAEKTTDYPWVKSYGKHCDTDYFRLMKSSAVYIDGFLQVRYVRRHATCEHCGQEYDWKDTTMEIVPYEVEYLQRFRTEEEAEALQVERKEQAARDILERMKQEMGITVNETEISDGEITDAKDLEE